MAPSDRMYLLKAATLMIFVKIALRVIPFKRLYGFLSRLAPVPAASRTETRDLYQALRAVEITSRYTPLESTCLVQALTGQVLLARKGIPAELQIGVARGTANQVEAHAWVLCQGKVVIGNRHDLARYQVFPNLKENLV